MNTSTSTSATSTVQEAFRRAAGYDLLARCFAYPDGAAIDAMHEVAAATGHLLACGPLHGLLEALALAELDGLLAGYSECFTLTTSPDCPTFETAYLCSDPGQQTARMADINGFYLAFGVDASGTSFRPDDISVELEFMAFLCRKQAYAIEHLGAPRVAQAARAQRTFLAEHPGRWACALGEGMTRLAENSPFYRELGKALSGWIEAEARALHARIPEPVDRPLLPWPDRAERGGILGPPAAVFGADELAVLR